MLVRDRMELDRLGMIPQFMRDAWEKKYGDKYPTEETESMQRWVRVEGTVSWILTRLSFVFLIISALTILPATMGMFEEKELFLSVGRYSLLSAIPLYIIPKLLTRWIQSKTKSNEFGCAIGNALKWMELEPQDLGKHSPTKLEYLAEEALIQHTQRVLRLERIMSRFNGYNGDEYLHDLQVEMRMKFRVFADLGIFDAPWKPIFTEADERYRAAKVARAKC